MKKPENTFIAAIHRHLPPQLHVEKMANPYRGGTADCWYSGTKADLWVEYKFLPGIPKIIIPNLTALQLDWLASRHKEGRNVAVIVGCKTGGVIYRHPAWGTELSTGAFLSQLLERKQIASWICDETMEGNHDYQVRCTDLRRTGKNNSTGW